jgi:hypothetical protein
MNRFKEDVMKSKHEFEFDEELLSVGMGIAKTHLCEGRGAALKRGADWEVCGGRVLLSLQGAVALLGHLGFPQKKKGAELAATLAYARATSLPTAGEVRVRVVQIPRNTALVIGANMTKADELVRVLVGDNANFTPGMEFKAVHLAGADPDVFTLVGSKPRARGRW